MESLFYIALCFPLAFTPVEVQIAFLLAWALIEIGG